MAFKHAPQQPSSSECARAYEVLLAAREAAGTFLDLFEAARKSAKGVSTDAQQDLLRAMLLFASAGLDAMVKQLVRDALRKVVDKSEGSQKQFEEFIARKLRNEGQKATDFIAGVIAHKSPRDDLVQRWIDALTASSMQSFEQLATVCASFDVPTAAMGNISALKDVFKMRNQMAHEMDIQFGQSNRSRRQRARRSVCDAAETLFEAASKLLANVDQSVA